MIIWQQAATLQASGARTSDWIVQVKGCGFMPTTSVLSFLKAWKPSSPPVEIPSTLSQRLATAKLPEPYAGKPP